jgi:hypothetical protein
MLCKFSFSWALSSVLLLPWSTTTQAQSLRSSNNPSDGVEVHKADKSDIQLSQGGRTISCQVQDDTKTLVQLSLGSGRTISLLTDPSQRTFQITSSFANAVATANAGSKYMGQAEKGFLKILANMMEADDRFDTGIMESTASQCRRACSLLSDWPDELIVDFTYSPELEAQRMAALNRVNEPLQVQDLQGNPHPTRGRTLTERRLDWTSLCPYLNYYVQVTHDDFWYYRGDDRTTFFALIKNSATGPCADGTYFGTGPSGPWTCYEPDHSASIEYAYGDCFGRCGAGCGSDGSVYSLDCADHDSCVRFGHSTASGWCNDEFLSCSDDYLYGANCY